jgi:hypothetical protein
MLLAGATLALLLTFWHTYALSGHVLGGSTRTKMLWASRSSFSLQPFWQLSLDALGMPQRGRSRVVLFLLVVLIVAGTLLPAWRNLRLCLHELSLPQANLCVVSLLALVAYMVLFGMNPSALDWYTSTIMLPVCIIVAACTALVWRLGRPALRMLAVVYWCALVAYAAADGFIERGHMQLLYYKAAVQLRQELPGVRIGCWSCGILSFYSAGPQRPPLINLDGLVNDDVYPYIKSNNLASYIVDQHIRYLLDESAYIETRRPRILGGYDSERFLKMPSLVQAFPYSATANEFTVLSLYRLEY